MLIALDRAVKAADRDWSDYLVTAVRDFVIWGLPPAGVLDREKADWLLATLSNGGLTKNGRTIFREVSREARRIDDDAPLAPVAERKAQAPGEGDLPVFNHAAA